MRGADSVYTLGMNRRAFLKLTAGVAAIATLGLQLVGLKPRRMADVYVHGDTGSDLVGDGTKAHPFRTILHAMQAHPDLHTVHVLGGNVDISHVRQTIPQLNVYSGTISSLGIPAMAWLTAQPPARHS